MVVRREEVLRDGVNVHHRAIHKMRFMHMRIALEVFGVGGGCIVVLYNWKATDGENFFRGNISYGLRWRWSLKTCLDVALVTEETSEWKSAMSSKREGKVSGRDM